MKEKCYTAKSHKSECMSRIFVSIIISPKMSLHFTHLNLHPTLVPYVGTLRRYPTLYPTPYPTYTPTQGLPIPYTVPIGFRYGRVQFRLCAVLKRLFLTNRVEKRRFPLSFVCTGESHVVSGFLKSRTSTDAILPSSDQ